MYTLCSPFFPIHFDPWGKVTANQLIPLIHFISLSASDCMFHGVHLSQASPATPPPSTCKEPWWFGQHAKISTALTNTLKAHYNSFCKSVHVHCVTIVPLLNVLSIPLMPLDLTTQCTSAIASQGSYFQVLWCATWSWSQKHSNIHSYTHNHHFCFL